MSCSTLRLFAEFCADFAAASLVGGVWLVLRFQSVRQWLSGAAS
jgi:hypothetical protein